MTISDLSMMTKCPLFSATISLLFLESDSNSLDKIGNEIQGKKLGHLAF
jgi:hypothetical protein